MNRAAQYIEAFSALASGFCRWCEAESLGRDSERRAAIWLAQLHAAAMQLPEIDGDDGNSLPEIPLAELETAKRNLYAFSGWYYRTLLDPSPKSKDAPVMGDLGDDIMDIYKDLKIGCLLTQLGRQEEAIWQWWYMHRIHWGSHVVGSLAALHAHELERNNAA